MRLPTIVSGESSAPIVGDSLRGDLPDGVSRVDVHLMTLTRSITVVVACFFLAEDRAAEIDAILKVQCRAQFTVTNGFRNVSLSYPDAVKYKSVVEWRNRLYRQTEDWFLQHIPGSICRMRPKKLPVLDVVVTARARVGEADGDGDALPYSMIFTGATPTTWECPTLPGFRLLSGPSLPDSVHQGLNIMTLTARLDDIVGEEQRHQPDKRSGLVARALAGAATNVVDQFIARLAVTAFLHELSDEMVRTSDLAERIVDKSSVRDLERLRRKLVRTNLDGASSAADIAQLAEDERRWRFGGVPVFRTASPRDHQLADFSDALRNEQARDASLVMERERRIRDVLSTIAQLNSAIENIRLQRRTVFVAIAALSVAIFSALAAVLSMRV